MSGWYNWLHECKSGNEMKDLSETKTSSVDQMRDWIRLLKFYDYSICWS